MNPNKSSIGDTQWLKVKIAQIISKVFVLPFDYVHENIQFGIYFHSPVKCISISLSSHSCAVVIHILVLPRIVADPSITMAISIKRVTVQYPRLRLFFDLWWSLQRMHHRNFQEVIGTRFPAPPITHTIIMNSTLFICKIDHQLLSLVYSVLSSTIRWFICMSTW